jgi:hypothetical protein
MSKFNLNSDEVKRILMLHENENRIRVKNLLIEGTLGSYTTGKINCFGGGISTACIPVKTTFTEVEGKPHIVRATNVKMVTTSGKRNLRDFPDPISISYYCNKDEFYWSRKFKGGDPDNSAKNIMGSLKNVLKEKVCYKSKESDDSKVVKSKSYFLYTKGKDNLKIFQGTKFVKKTDTNGKPYLISGKVTVQQVDILGFPVINKKSEIKYFCDTKSFGLNLKQEEGFESAFTSPNTRWYDTKKGLSTRLDKLCISTEGTSDEPISNVGSDDSGTKDVSTVKDQDQETVTQNDINNDTGTNTETDNTETNNTENKGTETELIDFIVPIFPESSSSNTTVTQQTNKITEF